ncbi:monocarboxylate transporter 2-like isoform X2 [Portunus trituberculatus]|uniref:monocarboxylate transporter 2-like isoform X2 n=1 Tax=Portunus trituberculatus TaxID=210409 RepID=UPI001E1CC506|nr:monocarboxylate transporter 2-like isoform X2 [Portunus trituberculatus]
MPEVHQMSQSGRTTGSGKGYSVVQVITPSEKAGSASRTAKSPTQDWTSRVPDGGWGWLVVGGSFIVAMVLPLLSQGFGVIFSRYLLQEGTSSSLNFWLFNAHSCLWNVMGLMVRPLTQEFGWRPMAITGVLLAFMALLLSAFTPSPVFLFFSFSLLSGTGGGLVIGMTYIIVPSYFNRRRGMANAVMMAGVCIGQMVGPPFLRFLQDEYGFQGATLILSGIILNCCVGAAFYHPVEWHLKPPLQPASPPCTEPAAKDSRQIESCGEEDEWVGLVAHMRGRGEDGTQRDREKSKSTKQDVVELKPDSDVPQQGVGLRMLVRRVARNTVADLVILRSPRALIIAFGSTFFIIGFYNFIMMVPFVMQIAGHSLADAANCISASAFANLVMRILGSVLSDYAWFNMRLAYMAGLAFTATSIMVFPLLESVPSMMVVMTTWGMGVGTTMSLFNLIMVKFMGLENLPPMFGGTSLILASGFLTIGPLVGLVRDTSGSYPVSMWVLSGYVYLAFFLWMFMPAAQAYDRRKMEAEAVAL